MKRKPRKNKKLLIKLRLEFFDALTREIRKRIELGEIIPDTKMLIQPEWVKI